MLYLAGMSSEIENTCLRIGFKIYCPPRSVGTSFLFSILEIFYPNPDIEKCPLMSYLIDVYFSIKSSAKD